MTAPPTKAGDVLFLFHKLPYDFEENLPLVIGPNVYLDNTPQYVLDEAYRILEDNSICPAFYLTSYGGIMNLCLRNPAAKVGSPEFNSSDLFFLSVIALRLRAPLEIETAMVFELGEHDELIKKCRLSRNKSPHHPDASTRYSPEDISVCKELTERQIHLWKLGYKRFTSALVLFGQVTCGMSESFQMTYLALFAALEALFVPSGNKATALARRVASFLTNYDFYLPYEDFEKYGTLENWLKNEYENGRNSLTHGVQDVTPWTKYSEPRAQTFGRLHEITRLCILGFMSLDDDKLAFHSESNGRRLQKGLDSLSPATGQFLDGQKMWTIL
jgi:hypothetical protein